MTQTEMTRVFMREMKLPDDKFKDFRWSWWHNPTNENSMRLTESGYKLLKNYLNIEHFSATVKTTLGKNLKIFLLLERNIKSPYYIERANRITFFGEQDFIMLTLMDGNLDQYLENLSG